MTNPAFVSIFSPVCWVFSEQDQKNKGRKQGKKMERATGIEPAWPAWEAGA